MMGKRTKSRFSEIKLPTRVDGLSVEDRKLLAQVRKDISLLKKCEGHFERFKREYDEFSSRYDKKVDKKLYGVFENREI